MNSAQAYIQDLANNLTKITLTDFFKSVHEQFYSDQDISFMEEFLEWTQHENEFVIHHSKLRQYGIMTSTDAFDVKKKIERLGLVIDRDYNLRHVSEVRKDRGSVKSNHYYLTPEGFKKCLMRAQRRNDQPVDPVIYCDYYILLEKIHKLYTDYELKYLTKLLAMKDERIDNLTNKIDEQTNKINQLLNYGNKITKQNEELIDRTDHLQITVDMTQDDLDKSLHYNKEILNHLVDKSYKSTINPENPEQITHFAVFRPNDPDNKNTILTRGQLRRVNMMISKYADTHTVLINSTYNANAINLIINAKRHYEESRDEYIAQCNISIIERNEQLKKEIAAYNRKNKSNRRSYVDSKQPLLRIKDIPIKFGTTYITYEDNPHISYEKVIESIIAVNIKTQTSPVVSESNTSEEEFDSESDQPNDSESE